MGEMRGHDWRRRQRSEERGRHGSMVAIVRAGSAEVGKDG